MSILTLLVCSPTDTYLQQTAASETSQRAGSFERIILTWSDNPATTQAVTWRTGTADMQAIAQIAKADASPFFGNNARRIPATTNGLQLDNGEVYYHSVNFTNLTPDTLYAYRVGNGAHWSEWFQFRTAHDQPESFSFIYFGDAQNNIRSLWSRAIRSAILESPKARFLIHAGDLVNHGDSDDEWGEWFDAGDWLFAMVPSLPATGNHEYHNERGSRKRLSPFWRPQFMLPENGIEELKETVYYIDYQGVRIVVLNSNKKIKKQARWLEKILKQNPNHWTVVAFHHPVHPTFYLDNEKRLDKIWKPLFEKYNVDLILQGHEHIYARGFGTSLGRETNAQRSAGPLYITSVSGPKMYRLKNRRWLDRVGENMQLFQVISVSRDTLHYRAVTVAGELYDAFKLLKEKNGKKVFIEEIPPDSPERRME
ncbi:MAG: metallophosphoesterase family protein [Deltaproteobacteria bacterium]|nr:metallophosphoesterase family protein [Deltaproteobacteria bacterium]